MHESWPGIEGEDGSVSVYNWGGLYGAIDVALFVLIIGGFLGMTMATGAIDAGIGKITTALKGREKWMIAILMIAGCVMETTPNIVILAPLLLPLAQEIGMNEVHFCIFMVTALGIGFITPPLGLNLFVVSGVTQTPIISISRYVFPFVFSMLAIALLIGYVPWISLWLIK